MGEVEDPGREWMLDLKGGDEGAFRRIVHHYGRQMVAFFRRYGADAMTAEDLSQEAFLRIYRARERYEPTAKFSTWLYRILHRLAMNEGTRNRWRRSVSLDSPSDDSEGPGLPSEPDDSALDPKAELDRGEARAQVRKAVMELPESQRTALVLNRFQGLSYEEVGEILGLKIPAVKSLLFRARDNVRKKLMPYFEEEVRDES